jgi:hypothetical protein
MSRVPAAAEKSTKNAVEETCKTTEFVVHCSWFGVYELLTNNYELHEKENIG